MNTDLLYMIDSYLFEESAKVVSVSRAEDGRTVVILDRTIFYPQGGGQRFDIGKIAFDSAIFDVVEVRFVEGEAFHMGSFEKGTFQAGDEVRLGIDKDRRILHNKLQSAGHLIDMGIKNLGYTDLVPAKGAHYPEWSEVEYEGEINLDKIESVPEKLQKELDSMIEKGYEVKVEMSTKEEAQKKCYTLPAELPDNKPIRIVAVWDDLFMPCGGTHVQNINELKGLKITRIKSKKGMTKISYTIT
ncbi:MAG: alanine--tRNA ligase-related protein [Candidatus Roizmanbacteria bacterium]